MNETCGTCRFWDDSIAGSDGLCRRHAPRAYRTWPTTGADDWCGEFEPIEDEDAKPDETLDPPDDPPDAL